MRERLDGLRAPLGAVFLAGYAYVSLAPDSSSWGMTVFLVSGGILWALSVPYSSRFHQALTLAAFAAFGVLLFSGRFQAASFVGGLPTYFNIIAVLLVLSVAGYPIRSERFTGQIRALMAALARRGAGTRATSGVLGHLLGAVLDVGSFVLIDVILRRSAPDKERLDALNWAARGFTFVPLWTNLNVFTATTIVLTGVAYPDLLAATLPFVIVGLAAMLFFARREHSALDEPPEALGRGAIAVLLYPVLLVAAVALVNVLVPSLSLTAAISVTVAVVVAGAATLAAALSRRTSPIKRLGRETRDSLTGSHGEFALFGSAGVLVLSLQELGALAPVGSLLTSLPQVLVAPALALIVGIGFVAGIHVLPLILLINAAFPLDAAPSPALWAAAILLGAQGALLTTPFSNSTTMLARLTDEHPLEIARRNWRFGVAVEIGGLLYLGLLTLLLL